MPTVIDSAWAAEDMRLAAGELTVSEPAPRVLHVEARLAVRRDRVRVHREDHVRLELLLDSGADLRVLDHRHPDRVPGHVAEVVAAVAEALRDRLVDVVRGRAWTHAVARGLVVLLVGLEHPQRLGVRLADRARDLDPVHPGACDLERGENEVAELRLRLRDRELGPDQHHVHRQPAAAALDEELLRRSHHRCRRFAGLVRCEEGLEAVLVDANALAHRVQLGVALDRTRVVELDIERNELCAASSARKSRTLMM